MTTFGRTRVAILLAIALILSVLAYSNTFTGEFQFDDDGTVAENPYVTDIGNFRGLTLAKSFVDGIRPVATFTFSVNYYFWGLDVLPYHVTNFAVHAICGLLVFYLALLTARSPGLLYDENRSLFIAFLTSAIFLLHPVQTESVSYISQRYESLASLFYLASLIAFIKARQAAGVPRRYTFYALSVAAGILALGSKQSAITLPLMIMLYDFYFLNEKPSLKRMAGPLIFLALAAVAGLIIIKGLKGADAGFSVQGFTPWEYLLTQFRAIVTYIRLLFLPAWQNLDYDFRISRSLFEIDTLLSFLFLLSLFVSALFLLRRARASSFFILWFFIILAPTSSIIPLVDPVFEHRVYLASAGVFFIFSDTMWAGLSWAWKRRPARGRALAISGALVLMLLLSGLTYERNEVWRTKLSMWLDVAMKSPMKSRPHNNLGNCYMLLERPVEAIEEYKKAIALDPGNIEAYYNISLNLEKTGRFDQAVYYYDIFSRNAPSRYERQKEFARKRVERFREIERLGFAAGQ
ncbi:MAG: tetratricopeptide repeat protein [Deltaproteobacteria bacterium]|nr:tetratricopeptide repeat protein [Deltaproteobacteria bacterium]MBZ0218995.1 tetratricopeptide repeat protein [Deltaproteobacteria bacterium]